MAFELIAAIALAFGVGGLVVLARRLTRGRLPKIVLPMAIAAALIGFAVWGDYSWASRTKAALPERLVVLDTMSQSDLWRPWTYLVPVSERMVVADIGGARRNPDLPDMALVDLLFMERRMETRQLPILLDCAGRRSAPVSDATSLSPQAVEGLDWSALPDDSPLPGALCQA